MPIQDPVVGLPRTNPQAHNPNNAVQLYGIEIEGDDASFVPTFNYAVTGAGALLTLTPTAGHNAVGIRYFKWRVIDEDSRELQNAAAVPAATPVAINTSSLDPLKAWRIEFSAGTEKAKRSWWLRLPAGSVLSNPAGSGQNV